MPALDFPNTPAVGDKYPTAPIQGVPTYIWDGEKWTSIAIARAVDLTGFLPLKGGTLSGPLILAADPTVPLGAATKQTVDANTTAITGKVAKIGDAMSGDLTIGKANAALWLSKPASGSATIINGQMGGVLRWQMALGDATAEASGNVGSNFQLARYTTAGAVIDAPLSINRATGAVTMAQALTVNGTLNTGGAASFPSVSVNGACTATGGFVSPNAGNGLSLYGTSYVFADPNYFAFGESGVVTDTNQWRYMFQRSNGMRTWFGWTGVQLMSLAGGGNLTIAGTLAQSSDAALKTDIEDAPDGIEAVRLMRPRRYQRIHPEPPDDHPGWAVEAREELGFIAQEMQEALPHAVRGDQGGLAVELMPILAALTNAVKQLDARLAAVGA
jgi:hypothetical protein